MLIATQCNEFPGRKGRPGLWKSAPYDVRLPRAPPKNDDKNCQSFGRLWLLVRLRSPVKIGPDLKFMLKINDLGGIRRFRSGTPCGFERAIQFMYSIWTIQ